MRPCFQSLSSVLSPHFEGRDFFLLSNKNRLPKMSAALSDHATPWAGCAPSGTIFEEQDIEEFLKIPKHLLFPTPKKGSRNKVIVISGPTGVGKTELSFKIAQALGGEIISADSMQVYKGMDIGTAKADLEMRSLVPHHLIDCRNLDQTFNVADFYEEASRAIQKVLSKGRVPIVVGGTGFYMHALLYGPPTGPPSVPAIRSKLETEMNYFGPEALYERLRQYDPEYALSITPGDRHKIIRALEIIALTNKKVSDFSKGSDRPAANCDFRCWFIYMPKEILYPRIELRCEQMIALGFVDEVKALEEKGLRNNLSASQAIGYRQCLKYLESSQAPEDWDVFVKAFKQASRQYAKRQFTWFRKEPLFRWLNVHEYSFEKSLEMLIQDYELSF